MGTVHTVAVHFRYDRYMRRLVNEFLLLHVTGWNIDFTGQNGAEVGGNHENRASILVLTVSGWAVG